jgi:DNA-binding CsgD family transcriptional regulator
MANAFEKAMGVQVVLAASSEQKASKRVYKPRAKESRSQAAIKWMLATGGSQRAASRKFSISPATISQTRKANREREYCPHCHRPMPKSPG